MTPTFRRELHLGLFAPGENMLLRTILGVVRQGSCVSDCGGGVVNIETTATNLGVQVRYAELLALKVEITNKGANRVSVHDGGSLVTFVEPGATCELPVGGKGVLTAKTLSGTSAVNVATYLRCICGFPEEPYTPPGDAPLEPIGAFLL